jgi:predicted metal-dependent phosphoesterase TrpH
MKNVMIILLVFLFSSFSFSKSGNNAVKMPEVLNVKSRRTMSLTKNLDIIKSKLVSTVMLFTGLNVFGQNLNNIQVPEMIQEDGRKMIRMPDILGYKTLKCDFHMHTIFSDGAVWPTIRVDEAWREGLDAIAITDHIENNPSKMFVGGDDNSSFEIAKPYAEKYNIILVRGGEISRDMPPGHFNALFLNDVNALDKKDYMDAFEAAKKQGAFIIWNHPGWKAQQPDTCKWWDIHTELLNKGMIHAVEVFNEQEFYPVTLDWCNEKNIAYTAASDIHGIIASTYNLDEFNRPLTLVFAKNRSEEALREALFAHHTVAWFGKYLAGKEEFLREIFKSAVTSTFHEETKYGNNYLVKNNCEITFELKAEDGTGFSIPANKETIINIKKNSSLKFTVSNLMITTKQSLTVDFPE